MGWRILVKFTNIRQTMLKLKTHSVLFVKKRAIYRLGIISLAYVPMHVTDFPVVNVHVDELSIAPIWQHNLCATYSANVNISFPVF
jgi:hypothetical protein